MLSVLLACLARRRVCVSQNGCATRRLQDNTPNIYVYIVWMVTIYVGCGYTVCIYVECMPPILHIRINNIILYVYLFCSSFILFFAYFFSPFLHFALAFSLPFPLSVCQTCLVSTLKGFCAIFNADFLQKNNNI